MLRTNLLSTSSRSRNRGARALALLAAPLALALCARAQSVIAPNVTWDADDYDLTDGVCDADQALPGNQCTLRAAMQNVQLPTAAASWIIQLQATTYTLSDWGTDDTCVGGDLDVFTNHDIVIQGFPGTTIDATPLATGGHPERVFDIHPTANARRVELRFLFVRGGRSGGFPGGGIRHRGGELALEATGVFDHQGGNGGAIYVGAPFSMNGGELSQSFALGSAGGGAYVDVFGATVSFHGVQFVGNTAAQSGGGLWIEPFTSASLTSCYFSSNASARGGGLALGGSATLQWCTFNGNTSTGAGGGVGQLFGSTLHATQCTFASNVSSSSGGGINAEPSTTCVVFDSFFDHNTAGTLGGGMFSGGFTRVERTTLAQNTALNGGGIHVLNFSGGTALALVNSTLSQNQAAGGSGGGLYFGGTTMSSVSSCTLAFNVASNAGAGIWSDTPAMVRGTLLFANTLPFNVKQNFAGSVGLTSLHANLDSDGTCAFPAGSQAGTAAAPLDPHLGPLQLNGGYAPTHGFQNCGPAHGNGACDDVNGVPLGVDERNFPRSAPCDVGAFEEQLLSCGSAIVNFCAGDGLTPGMTPCPCFPGAAGHGCSNSATPMGALLSWTGVPCNNDVVLFASSMPSSTTGIYLMGNAAISSGVVYGDGVRCVDGALVRLGTVIAVGGQSQYPPAGSPVTLAQRSNVIPCSGVVRYYQEYYRNAAAAFCPPATFNITNGLVVNW